MNNLAKCPLCKKGLGECKCNLEDYFDIEDDGSFDKLK